MKQKQFLQRVRKEFRMNGSLYLMAAVPFIFLLLFKYWPMYGIQIAFKDYSVSKGIIGSPWVGLKHFIRFVTSPKFGLIMKNTLFLGLYGLVTFPLPILLAVMLNYLANQRYKKWIQMVSYAPHFISTVVMVGIILQFLDKKSGMVNLLIGAFGGSAQNFMAKPDYFYHIYQWSGVWQGIGFASIIYIAALSGVPQDLHEAAIMDGAGLVQRIRHIDIPSIMPTICILLILDCGKILNVGYEKVYLMQNNLNLVSSEVISTYVYKQGLTASTPQYSYSTAVSIFTSVINLVLMLTVNKITDKFSGNGIW